MPIYEYCCSKCGKVFELLRRINDTTAVMCIQCGSNEVKKMPPRSTSFQLRGTGWYETDFKGSDNHGSTTGGQK